MVETPFRYDGIYKIVKYWQSTGKSGFKVWRYLLRRDDPIPAPWTKEGKKRTAELGLEMQVNIVIVFCKEKKKNCLFYVPVFFISNCNFFLCIFYVYMYNSFLFVDHEDKI